VVFTTLAGEFGRVHSRYYFFLYPVALLLLFHLPSIRLKRAAQVVGIVFMTVAVVSMLLCAHTYSEILPVSLVSDSPEWGFVFFQREIFWAAMAAFIFAAVLAVLRPERFIYLIVVICITSVLSSIDVAVKQKTIFRGGFVTGREAVAVEEIVGLNEMHRAVVVGENRDVISKFLFYLTSAPNVEEVASGIDLEQVANKYPHATRIVVISKGYSFPSHFRCEPVPSHVMICSVDRR